MISKRVLLTAVALLAVAATGMAATVNVGNFSVAQLAIGSVDQLNLNATNSYGIVGGTVTTPTPTAFSAVNNYVIHGFAGAAWNGVGGINSSIAAGDANQITAVGIMSGDSAINYLGQTDYHGHTIAAADSLLAVVKYGDANLDGLIDGSDYALIDYGYQNGFANSGAGWILGDFTYDGLIDGSDYAYIDYVYQNFPSAAASAAAVPEPSSVILLVASAVCAMFVYLRKR